MSTIEKRNECINPFEVLDLKDDCSKSEVMKAVALAMKKKKYSLKEIMIAQKMLLNDSRRVLFEFLSSFNLDALFEVERNKKMDLESVSKVRDLKYLDAM